MYVNGNGDLKCDGSEDGGEENFVIEAQDDGRWAIKSQKYGWYVGSPDPAEKCAFEADLQEKHLWVMHLAMHPQVCLRNVNRKTYMHLDDGKLCTDEVIPWGDDATMMLHFFDENGTYGLVTSNGKFFEANGSLTDAPNENCQFILVFQDSMVSFKSKSNGKFITGLGKQGTAKASKSTITKDEQWLIEDSHPQLKFTAVNGKQLSIKQGVEVAAAQTTSNDEEIFQIQPDEGADTWTFKCRPHPDSHQCKYWEVKEGALTATAENTSGPESHFTIEWLGNKVAIKDHSGKYLKQMKNGYIHASGDSASDDDATTYVWEIVNRPRLILRGEYGFVGTLPSALLQCSVSTPETYAMEISQGFCKISHTGTGKYWTVKGDGSKVVADGSEPTTFTMSLHKDSRMCLMHTGSDGKVKYLTYHQNGDLTMTGDKPTTATLFEY